MSINGTGALNGSLTARAGTINLSAGTGLTVNQALNAMNGGINISVPNGAFTTGTSGTLTTTNGTVNISTGNAAVGTINLGAGINVFGTALSGINISSARNLTTNSLFNSTTGDMNLTAGVGTLQLNGSIQGRGNINVRHTGIAAGDRIIVGPFASIQALAPSSPLGNISIAITNGGVTNIAGVVPVGGTVSQTTSGGGQIFFGPGQFTNSGFTTLNAKGANITFFRDAAAADGVNAIQLNSNFLFADPPVGGAVPANALLAIPGAAIPTAPSVTPAGATSSSEPRFFTAPMQTAPMIFGRPTATETPLRGDLTNVTPVLAPSANSSASADALPAAKDFVGAVMQSTAANANALLTGFVAKKTAFFGGSAAYIRSADHTSVTGVDETTFDLSRGEVVLSASRRTSINAGLHSVDVAPGAIVHVFKDGAVLKVRSLCDTGKATHVMVAGKAVRLSAGEELAVGTDSGSVNDSISQDKIGRREVHRFVVDNKHHLVKSELSMIGLIQKSSLLSTMYSKGSQTDRNVMERVMKMAAALFQVTGKRGAYSAYDPTKTREVSEVRTETRALEVAAR